jgi:hypothetical protein
MTLKSKLINNKYRKWISSKFETSAIHMALLRDAAQGKLLG